MWLALWLAALAPPLDENLTWEITKGVLLTASTGLLGWCAVMLRQVLTQQTKVNHFLFGVEGDNGLRAIVKQLRTDMDVVLERNLRIDSVVEAEERRQYHGPDRRAGARRLRDVVHDAQDERFHQTHEHPTHGHSRRAEDNPE